MPKLLPIPEPTAEQRLRDALRLLLDRLGALPPCVGVESDERLIWLASRVQLGRHEFAVVPELDENIPF